MVHEALRLIRVYHDLTQNQLSARVGISAAHLCLIEKGQRGINVKLIDRYAKALNIRPSSILFFAEHLEHGLAPADGASDYIDRRILTYLQLLKERVSL